MSYITKNRIKNWLLIFLLVTNIATISTILYHRWYFRKYMEENNPRQRIREYVNNELGLSPEQKAQIKKENNETDSSREVLYYEMEDLEISVYSQLANPKPDSIIIDSLVKEISDIYSQINYLGVSHNLYMLNVCNPEQRVKLSKKYQERVDKMKAEQIEESKENKK
ncbi:MAG TPA: hypothetical protein PKK00_03305 [Bacteroidales bacterium]|nr:hypothetical protein [Bacteroidales bacterium]HPS15651.1 hypothetical protein [Bacteroidales bacterium]